MIHVIRYFVAVEMDKNNFNIYDDFLEPILNFLNRHILLNVINDESQIRKFLKLLITK